MKKNIIKNTIIPLVVYPFDVMVSIGESDEELKKNLIKRLPPSILKDELHLVKLFNLSDGVRGHSTMFSGGQTVLRLKYLPVYPEYRGVLSHEVFHIVQFIMDKIGMPLTNSSDEAYAYLIQYLTEQIYERFRVKNATGKIV